MSMSKQTNKTLPSDKLSSLALSGSAAAAILLPQAITALYQGCTIYSAGSALLHGRLRQLRCKLRRQRCRHCFFITLS